MDDQLLNHLYHRLCAPDKVQRPAHGHYSDSIVVLLYFLGVIRDRSPRWAHEKRNWPLWMRRLARPSYSQLMRRLTTASVQRLIVELNAEFRGQLPSSGEKFSDGKPLTVGGFSRDPDTAQGKLPGGGWGRGYKLHVIVDACGAVDVFELTALNAGEATVMRRLAALADLRGVLLRGDSNYDSNPLYAAVAARGGRLIAPRKKPGTGLGHQPHHPHRLRAIEELERRRGGGDEARRAHKRHRIRVEQALGHLSNLPCGLSPLPNCVRRKRRVARWVLAKITLYHLALILRQTQKLAA